MDPPNPLSSSPTTSATFTATPTNTTADESAAIEVKKRDRTDEIDSELTKFEDGIESIKQEIESIEQEIESIKQEFKSTTQNIESTTHKIESITQALQDAQAKADMENPPVHTRDYWMDKVKHLEVQQNYLHESLLVHNKLLLVKEERLREKDKRLHEQKDKLSDEVAQLHDEKRQRVNNMQSRAAAQARARAFLDAIMSELEDIPDSNGMRVMRNVPNLETGVEGVVVIRTITEPFWQACIDTVRKENPKHRVCAVGSPGIGMSTSTPFLIRMVLKENGTVVYRIQTNEKDGWFYEFKLINDEYQVEVYPFSLDWSSIPSFDEPSTFYIVDPGKTTTSCDPRTTFLPRVIIIASPDDCHWGRTEFTKDRSGISGTFRYYPIWEYEELVAAKSELNKELSEEDILLRYHRVGGIPRTIFRSGDLKQALDMQDDAINALGVENARRLATNRLDVVSSFERTQPKSAIIGYTRDENDNCFIEKKVVIVSCLVAEKVTRKYMSELWNDMILLGDNGWWMFEAYTRELMKRKEKVQLECRECCGKNDARYKKHKTRSFGGCTKMRVVDDITAAPLAETNIVFHSIRRQFKLIDFVYTDKHTVHAFQVTIGLTHSANESHIKDLVTKIPEGKTLMLYYLVPEQRFNDFVTNPVKPSDHGCSIFHVLVPDPNNESKPMDTSTN